MKCVRIQRPGGPEVLEVADVPTPHPGPGQALVRVIAAGVNFVDIYYRTGRYKAEMPLTLGREGAGVVEAIGPEVDEVATGDRVAYATVNGSYAEYAVIPAAQLVPIPDGIAYVTAAGVLLQGMTAHYLTQSAYQLQPREICLVHAAAGGLGSLVTQLAKRRGAAVFGTVSSEQKAEFVRQSGADETIDYVKTDFEAEVRRLTSGIGVHVVYDSVGKSTFEKSLNCLRPRGTLILCGESSGRVTAVDPAVLSAKGSLFFSRPALTHYVLTRGELLTRAGDVWEAVELGELRVRIDAKYSLSDAEAAHRDLEARRTTGKLVLAVR